MLKTVGLKLIKGAIEGAYQTPFKLLGKFNLQKSSKKLIKNFKDMSNNKQKQQQKYTFQFGNYKLLRNVSRLWFSSRGRH